LTEVAVARSRVLGCIHQLCDDFGSIAEIAPLLLQSSEAGSYSTAAAQRFSASSSAGVHSWARFSAPIAVLKDEFNGSIKQVAHFLFGQTT
jgi:hypothetical protein